MRRVPLTTTIALALLCTAAMGPATAVSPREARAPRAEVLAKGLVSPLSLAVGRDGTRWFSQNFTGGLYRQDPGRAAVGVYQSRNSDAEVGAVSERGGVVTFGVRVSKGQEPSTRTYLMRIGRDGKAEKLARIGAHERISNPDGAVTYGFQGLDAACAASLPAALGPATYTGTQDSHPYATLMTRRTTYVADAGANAVFAVSPRGRVSTVAVLPPVPVVITAAAAAANAMPACTVGRTYLFEPVPTDVEEGPDGALYISSLPGGPEDGSTGANGSVFRVDPATGSVTVIARGLLSPVGLAVAPNGDVYVSQLFAGVISRIAAGTSTATPWFSVPLPGDVEMVGTRVYATVRVLPGGPKDPPEGAVVRIRR